MLNNPDWQAVFAPGGCFLREGDTIRRTALARTLARVAAEGPDAFYRGPIADALLAKIRATGGIMTQADLDAYEVKVAPALKGTYRGRTVYTTHAPTSGPVLLHMLNLVEMIDGFVEDGRTAENMHRLVEVMKCRLRPCILGLPHCLPLSLLCSWFCRAVCRAASFPLLLRVCSCLYVERASPIRPSWKRRRLRR
jgi:gamma-glutamyltranspeptidase